MYLSNLLNSAVWDNSDKKVGTVKDALVQLKAGEYAPLLFLLVKGKKGKESYIPFDFVANVTKGEVVLKHLMSNIPQSKPQGEFVYLNRDVMDEQIVDFEGARVVRVNDLKIGPVLSLPMAVIGIDVSLKGILRRLKLRWLDVFDIIKVNLIDWRKAHLVKGVLKLDTIAKDLVKLHPADLANIVEDMSLKQGSTFVDALSSKAAAKVVEEMDPAIQKMIIHYLGPEKAADIVEHMSVDEAVDLMKMLPKREAAQFLSFLRSSTSKDVEKLLNYPDNTAGGLMTTEFMSGRPDWTVERMTEEVKKESPDMRTLLYIYILDESGKFIGVTSIRTLLVSDPKKTMAQIMKKAPHDSVLKVHDSINEVIRVMTKYNLFTAAVMEKGRKMVGVVTIDDVMRHLVPNA